MYRFPKLYCIVQLILLVCGVHPGESIRCHVCKGLENGWRGNTVGSPFSCPDVRDSTKVTELDCATAKNCLALSGTLTGVARMCSEPNHLPWISVAVNEMNNHTCDFTLSSSTQTILGVTTTVGFSGTVCACRDNLCSYNSALGTAPSLMLLTGLVAMIKALL